MIEQIRFSKHPRRPRKNTLFTILDGDTVYYGISKRRKGDERDDNMGINWARRRANMARAKEYSNLRSFVSKDRLMGKCPANETIDLLKRFRKVR